MCLIPGMYSIHIVNRLLVDGINAIVYIYILPGEETWSLGILINWRENAAGSKRPLTYVLLRIHLSHWHRYKMADVFETTWKYMNFD